MKIILFRKKINLPSQPFLIKFLMGLTFWDEVGNSNIGTSATKFKHLALKQNQETSLNGLFE